LQSSQGVVLETVVFPALRILAALLLVALNGLFVAAEFSLVKIRATQVDRLVEEGRAAAGLVKEATGKLDAYLAVCQLGITISSLGLGALGEPAIAALIEPLLEPLGIGDGTLHFIAFVVGFSIISFLHVVFGELAPKTIAIQSAEGTSLVVAPFMRFFYYLLLPATVVFNGTANAFTRLLGYPPASESDETHSEDEIRTLVTQSARQGMLERDEEGMISAVFELNDKTAREIMVPRPDVVAFPAETPVGELISLSAQGRYSRYPVYETDSFDRIVGAVHVKDVLRAVASETADPARTARDLMRDVLTIPENRRIDVILEDMRKQDLQVAVVIDEWGSFEGLFTLEDIVEEIVGEIRDEFDEEGPAVKEMADGSYVTDGRISINEVNQALGTDFESQDFETVGGLILGHLGRVPESGDEVRIDGHLLRVDQTNGPRIARIQIREPEEDGAEAG
jgi:CBS domain containing-hemolysin-like protein